jgi:hypothetical protein
MSRIAVRPDQVVVLDFDTRFPSPVTSLRRAQPVLSSKPTAWPGGFLGWMVLLLTAVPATCPIEFHR